MGKIIAFFTIIFLVVLSVLAYFNNEPVDVSIWNGITFENIPVIVLILISVGAGVVSMFIIGAVRDTRRYLGTWQIQRKQKKESKIQALYEKGIDALFASNYEEASDLFNKVILDDSSHLNALLRLGDISFEKNDYIKAKDFYLKAREIKPRGIEVLLSLEKVADATTNWPEAIKYLDSILEIDDSNIRILHKKRDIYESNKKWEEIIDVQQKILKSKLSPEDEQEENKKMLGYKYELGRHYLQVGDTDKAVKTLKSVMKSDKDFIAAYLALAEAYLKGGNNKDAEDILLKGFEATSSLVFLSRLEDYYINEGEPGTIIDLYQKAVQKDQTDMRLQFFLAKLYYRLEMIDYALETIDSIDTTNFDYPDLHTLLGNVYERRADHEKAAAEFKQALNAEKPLILPFCCSECSFTSNDWSGRCPNCNRWNTFILDINEICKIQKRQSSS